MFKLSHHHLFFLLVLPITTLFLLSCNSVNKNAVQLNGTIQNAGQTWIKLWKVTTTENILIDSTQIDNNEFDLNFETPERSFFLLSYRQKESILLCADKGESISISGNALDLEKNYTLSGSTESQVLWEYLKICSIYEQKIDSIGAFLKASQSEPDFPEIRRTLDSVFLDISSQLRSELFKFVELHDTAFATMLILNRAVAGKKVFDPVKDGELFRIVSQNLSTRYSGNSFYKQFSSGISKQEAHSDNSLPVAKSFEIGQKLPEINLPDISDNMRSLSSTHGKLILLYFWTSWNQECRERNIQLASLKEEYSDKGFNIYSVSLDTDTQAWQVAVRADKAYWPQVIDTSGLASGIAREFNVYQLPMMFLLDEKGKLLAQNIKLDELKRILMRTL